MNVPDVNPRNAEKKKKKKKEKKEIQNELRQVLQNRTPHNI